ncbi:MAG: hypothetical protein KAT37_01990 [Candidatus Aenigmarchaeota archaeon]|nr:hypothetical protein [Candidatus Aenigmarchaeota archaeon]
MDIKEVHKSSFGKDGDIDTLILLFPGEEEPKKYKIVLYKIEKTEHRYNDLKEIASVETGDIAYATLGNLASSSRPIPKDIHTEEGAKKYIESAIDYMISMI